MQEFYKGLLLYFFCPNENSIYYYTDTITRLQYYEIGGILHLRFKVLDYSLNLDADGKLNLECKKT